MIFKWCKDAIFFVFFQIIIQKNAKTREINGKLNKYFLFFPNYYYLFFIFSFVSFLFIIDCERKYIEKNLRPDKGNLSGRRFDIDTKIIRIESCKESVYF